MLRIVSLAAFVAALAAVVAGVTYSGRTAEAEPVPDSRVREPAPRPRTETIRVYFVKGEQLSPVQRTVAAAEPSVVAARAVELLLAGPNEGERARGVETAIPEGTSLRSLALDGGTATVELNAEPSPPAAAERAGRPARAAQIVYTLTKLPGVERVGIDVYGVDRQAFLGSDPRLREPVDRHDLSEPVRPKQPPAPVPPATAPVEAGSVQKRLAALGYLPANAVTGAWNDRTEQAVLAFQSWQGLARDGIVGPRTTAALETAVRPRPSSGGEGRRVEVHRAEGVVLLVEGREVVRVVHASSGAAGYETPAGSYSVFRKEVNSWSVPYRVWLPYASYFNGGIALHGYAEVPAWPASHGCVRLSASEAPFVYQFAAVGTPVAVY